MTDKFQRHVQAARARAQAGFVPAEPLIAALEVLAAERAVRFRDTTSRAIADDIYQDKLAREAAERAVRFTNPTIGMVAPPVDGLNWAKTDRVHNEFREACTRLIANTPGRVGYIGMDGFHTEERPASRFEGPVEGFSTRRSVSHWGMVG